MGKKGQRMELLEFKDGSYRFNGIVMKNEKAFEELDAFRGNEQVFVCGRSDLFHEDIDDAYRKRIIDAGLQRPDCTFFAITKRHVGLGNYSYSIPNNFWLSVSVENQKMADMRLPYLRNVKAVRIVSAKPLLGRIDFRRHLGSFDMIIVGGEYGKFAKPMHPSWPKEIRDFCIEHNIPFSFHNWGLWIPGNGKNQICVDNEVMHRNDGNINGYYLEGKLWDQYPK
jgi:protein gp37